jgi:hypothetical protein
MDESSRGKKLIFSAILFLIVLVFAELIASEALLLRMRRSDYENFHCVNLVTLRRSMSSTRLDLKSGYFRIIDFSFGKHSNPNPTALSIPNWVIGNCPVKAL